MDYALPPGPHLHHCLDYFTMSADAMLQHALLCKSMGAGNDNDREESPSDYAEDDNSDDDFEFAFKED